MFEKIVIATDLSKSSDAVIGCLRGLRILGAQEAILVHSLGLKYMKDVIPILIQLAEPRLSEQKEILDYQGFSTKLQIANGVPMVEVNRIAQEENASLIVVGAQGANCAQELLLGGPALAILHYARRPVLLIQIKISDKHTPPRCEASFQDSFKRILYATDFSETAERAFPYVERIVETSAKRVTLLHVQEKSDLSKHMEHRLEEFNQIDRERLERMRDRLLTLGATDVQIEIPYGSPLQEIIHRAAENDHGLIVMGSKGRGFLAEVFLGSVSHGVALHVEIPLLMIPPAP
jgi:nucleotide-binding universal stress UspA family protein